MLEGDALLNVVQRLEHLGFTPRRVADDRWVARCPLCGTERALTVAGRPLVACRNPNCRDFRILQTIGLPGKTAYTRTHPWIRDQLNAVPVEPLTDDVIPIEAPPAPGAPSVAMSTGAPPHAEPTYANGAGSALAEGQLDAPASEVAAEHEQVMVAEALPDHDGGFVSGGSDARAGGTSHGETVPAVHAEAQVPSAAETLASLAATARPLRGSDGHYYAALPVGERSELYRVESAELRRALSRMHAQSTGRYPAPAAMATELSALRARAENSDRVDSVYLRVARDPSGTAYLLDLGDPTRRAVKISAQGWEVVESHGVPFWRPPGQRALPLPVRGGSLDSLRRFANVSAPTWPLLIGWLTSALRPVGPYPVLVLSGEQGSAKTTLARVCRLLIDPATGPLRMLPKSERDVMVGAQNNWLQVFDNLGTLAPWQSDVFCRLSSGGAFATRGLFTDDREFVIEAQRPIILNGIADFVRHADLADRSVFLWMKPVPESKRLGDLAIWEEFDREHGRLLGALLDAVAGGIRFWPEVQLKAMTRMADFDRWGEAVMCGLGYPAGTFVGAYRANRRSACEQALEESPVVLALTAALDRDLGLQCSPTELLRILNRFKPEHATAGTGWPRTPGALSRLLGRLAPQLRGIGINFTMTHEHNGRVITVFRPVPKSRMGPAPPG
jgi:hypothetical protein